MFVTGDPTLTPDALPSACRGARLMQKPFDLLELAAEVRALLAMPDATPPSPGTAS